MLALLSHYWIQIKIKIDMPKKNRTTFFKWKRRNNTCFFLLIFSILFQKIHAAEIFNSETIVVENRSPIIQLFSLSRPDYTLQKLTNTTHWKSRFELTNYFSTNQKENEILFIDGETWTITNTFQHQLSSNFILNVNIPWLKHSEGVLDHFIYSFHELFQLPQNGRTNTNYDLVTWNLRTNDSQTILIKEDKSGIGDIQVKLSWNPEQLLNTQVSALVKLPTGNFEDQTGSENIDFGISIAQSNPDWLKKRNWLSAFPLSVWYGAGINYLGKIDDLEDFNAHQFVMTFRSGIAWSIFPSWNIKTQFDSNTPLFDSSIRELGWMPVQVSISTEHMLSEAITFDFIMTQDLRPRASPDITFSTGLSVQF